MLLIQLAILLGCAWLFAKVTKKLGLPEILGMIIAGVLVGNWLFPLLSHSESTKFETFSSTARMAVLAIVLLRAGLGLPLQEIRKSGLLAIAMGVVPMLCDAVLVCLAAVWLLGLSLPGAVVLGFLVAAISPAIVIPGLLDRIQRSTGASRRLATALLAGAPFDNVVAILLLGISVNLMQAQTDSLGMSLLHFPYAIGVSVLLGWLLGRVVVWMLAPLALRWHAIGLMLLFAWLLIGVCRYAQIDFVICILVFGSAVRARLPHELAESHNQGLARVWQFAQYLLFSLIGAALDVEPLHSVGLVAIGVIGLGQVGRALATLVTTKAFGIGTKASLACVLSYIPKATIQAAFASMPLEAGIPQAHLHLSIAVLAIVVTVPVGVILGHRFIDQLIQIDHQADPLCSSDVS